ncbi:MULTISPECIES: FtsX-like permease family protein [Kitasatospora]|uniref:Putative membrane protein n=1 Tax=Kitasatospora setae (strain ATCC 33774 / DSM 43861 / JCM 3304 / KCC A-0304 / NBRC 14216 / KM-6054) TaxID=452652 RepID=E4NFC0_KITSK|nr:MULTISPECIES: FtsX-like permease family protein [Kitasatospora]BAJ30200.1 putative membrane protein [Kitasatospora setae KM-6054]
MSALRAVLRIARRDAWRAKGRSALVAAMIALPVLGATGVDVVHRSGQPTADQRADRLMGRADGLIGAHDPGRTIEQAVFPADGVRTLPQRPDAAPGPEQLRAAGTEPAALLGELLPPGSVLTPARTGPVAAVRSRDGLAATDTFEADLTGRLWQGRIDLVAGRAPAAPHEAAATRALLDAAGLRIGDTVTVRGLESTPFTLTGTVEHPGDLNAVELVARPGELYRQLDEAQAAAGLAPQTPTATEAAARKAAWLVTLPAGAKLGWDRVRELNAYGYTLASRQVAADPPAEALARQDAVGARDARERRVMTAATTAAMALLEVALLAGPAFAVGARRARRQLALLGAAGGRPGHVRAVVLGGGLVLGLVGAAAGSLLGVGLVAALRPWIEEWGGSRFTGLAARPAELLAIAAVGVATALLAALLPALQAGRREVLAGLTDRDPVRRTSRRTPLLGLAAVLGGAALALYGAVAGPAGGPPVLAGLSVRTLSVLGGAVLAELGLLLFTPLLLALLGRLAHRLPVGPRLALRDAARHRSRTAPAVAAVLAAVAGAVAVGVHGTGAEIQDRAAYRLEQPVGAVRLTLHGDGDTMPQLRTALPQDLPDLGERADLYQAEYVFCEGCLGVVHAQGGQRYGADVAVPAVVGDPTALHNLLALRDQDADRALLAGKAVVTDPAYLHDGQAVLRMQGNGGEVRELRIDALLVERPAGQRYAPLVVAPDTIRRLGLRVAPAGAVWLPSAPIGERAEQRAAATVARLAPHAEFHVERGYTPEGGTVRIALGGFAALVVLGAATVSTALAAADARRERALLSAIGARPRTRRAIAGLQAGLITLLGALLGTASGFVPAFALLRSRASGVLGGPAVSPADAPWTTIALLALGLPLLAGLLGALRRDDPAGWRG